MTTLLPAGIQDSLKQACDTCSEYFGKAQEAYVAVEKALVEGLKQVLPENVKTLAERIGKAVPETVFSALMVTGVLKPVSLLFWAARLIWVATPIIKSVFQGELHQEAMKTASDESLKRLEGQYEKFVPAIAVSCAVVAAYCGVFGLLTLSPTLIMKGSFLATLSYLAYRNMVDGVKGQTPPAAAGAPTRT